VITRDNCTRTRPRPHRRQSRRRVQCGSSHTSCRRRRSATRRTDLISICRTSITISSLWYVVDFDVSFCNKIVFCGFVCTNKYCFFVVARGFRQLAPKGKLKNKIKRTISSYRLKICKLKIQTHSIFRNSFKDVLRFLEQMHPKHVTKPTEPRFFLFFIIIILLYCPFLRVVSLMKKMFRSMLYSIYAGIYVCFSRFEFMFKKIHLRLVWFKLHSEKNRRYPLDRFNGQPVLCLFFDL
jgi:hypothetical protein